MGRDLVMWNIMVLMNIYIPDWQRKSFFHALFFANISIWTAVLLRINS